jgi:hypothetical protein
MIQNLEAYSLEASARSALIGSVMLQKQHRRLIGGGTGKNST